MKSHFSWDFVLAPFQLKNIAVVNSSAKNTTVSGSLVGPWSLAYRLRYLQTKSKEQIRPLDLHIKKQNIAFVTRAESFIMKLIFHNVPTKMYIKKLTSTRKSGRMHIWQLAREPVGFMQSRFFMLVSMWFPGHYMVTMSRPCGVHVETI